jgi:hypothetical protein
LAESTVLFRRDEFLASLNLIDRIEANHSLDEFTLERTLALRRAMLSASRAKSWEKVKRYAGRGLELSEALSESSLGKVAMIAFLAEMGWAHHEMGDTRVAAELFGKVVEALESFPNQDYPLFHILRLRFGHTLGWLGHFLSLGSQRSEEQEDYKRPFCGVFANFEDPPRDIWSRTGVPYSGCWSCIREVCRMVFAEGPRKVLLEQGVSGW